MAGRRALGLRGLGLRGRRHDDIHKGQYISKKRFGQKARGCKSTSVGADLSRPPPIYRPSLAVPLSAVWCETVQYLVPTDSSSFPYLKSISPCGYPGPFLAPAQLTVISTVNAMFGLAHQEQPAHPGRSAAPVKPERLDSGHPAFHVSRQ